MTSNGLTDSWERVGQTVKTLREARGLKPDELANAIGISRPYLANIEAGRKRLTPVLSARIAAALHVSQLSIIDPGRAEAS
jgi:transcriptional regulator with XRE-family HTH domain